jgi:hypothetical protein
VPRSLASLDKDGYSSIVSLLNKTARILLERGHLIIQLRIMTVSRVVLHISMLAVEGFRLVNTYVISLTLPIFDESR